MSEQIFFFWKDSLPNKKILSENTDIGLHLKTKKYPFDVWLKTTQA